MSLTPQDVDELARLNYSDGYANGLAAARDAVAALCDPDDGWDRGMGWNKGRYDALTAIDALIDNEEER